LKSTDADFPLRAIEKAGYGAVWRGQKDLERRRHPGAKADPVLIRTALPGDPDDKEARYIEAAVRASSSPAFTFRTAIRSPVRNSTTSSNGSGGSSRMPRNSSNRHPVVLAGDYNVAPTELDFIRPNHGTRMR